MQDNSIPPIPPTSQTSTGTQNESNDGYDGVFFDATKPLDNIPTQNTQEVQSQCNLNHVMLTLFL